MLSQISQISERNGGILAQKSVCNQLSPGGVWMAFISGSYDFKGLFYRWTFAINISYLMASKHINNPLKSLQSLFDDSTLVCTSAGASNGMGCHIFVLCCALNLSDVQESKVCSSQLCFMEERSSRLWAAMN